MTPVTVLYTLARTYLVVECFLSLRSLPRVVGLSSLWSGQSWYPISRYPIVTYYIDDYSMVQCLPCYVLIPMAFLYGRHLGTDNLVQMSRLF